MSYTRLALPDSDRDYRQHYIRQIVPEAFTEAGIDWEVLQDALQIPREDTDDAPEHYGLTWPGKREARRLAASPTHATLIPLAGRGIEEEHTGNIFIEGDNLEVLKVMQRAYVDRVKMIYIDPPYNTGNDFVYDDDYSDSLADYLRRTSSIDEYGRLLTTNTRADGRFHSKWLSMMYPRLRLMHNLLSADGAIFISIDDNESCRLRQIMDEIFGEENFVAQIVVQNNPRGRHLDRFIARTHDYILTYVKDITQHAIFEIEKDERMSAEYRHHDENGDYRELELRNRNPAFNRATRPNLYYAIYADPKSGAVSLDRSARFNVAVYPKNSKGEDSCWTWSKVKLSMQTGDVLARKATDGTWRVFRKDYLLSATGERATTMPKSLWLDRDYNNDVGKKAVQELFDGQSVFDFPKPVPLVRKLISIGAGPNDLVCDFFSGSATTAQAVLEENAARGTHRSFISVQIPAPLPKGSVASSLGFDTLASLAEERIRRVAKALRTKATDMAKKGLGVKGRQELNWTGALRSTGLENPTSPPGKATQGTIFRRSAACSMHQQTR